MRFQPRRAGNAACRQFARQAPDRHAPTRRSAVLPDRTGGNRTIRAVSSWQWGGTCVPGAARAAALASRAVTLGDPLGRSLERGDEREERQQRPEQPRRKIERADREDDGAAAGEL